MRKHTKQSTIAITTGFFNDMQNAEFRGSNFNESTFNIERWVDSQLCLLVSNVSKKEKEEVKLLARKLWDDLSKNRLSTLIKGN